SFYLLTAPPPLATLFPYTTLFRSAPERLLEMCNQQRGLSGDEPLAPDYWRRRITDLAARGLRLLALAEKNVDDEQRLLGFEDIRSEEHTSELQSRENLVCRLLLEK